MSLYSANYIETHIEYLDLTKIVCCPTYDTLQVLKNEIKANALSVHSNLRGGQHGHLGLAISPVAYVHVSNAAYDTPVYPSKLVIAAQTTCQVADHSTSRTHAESL